MRPRPKKSLGQHFLTDPKTLDRIVRAAHLQPGEAVLEIGPGTGNLTKRLLDAGCHLLAIEKDQALARSLPPHPHLELLEQDALDFPFHEMQGAHQGGPRRKVVANLPYNVATQLIIRLLPLYEQFSQLTVMIQWEVAKRLLAQPSTYERGSLSVFRELYAEGKLLFPVQPGCFVPPPKVKSAVIELRLKRPERAVDGETFLGFVREGFKTRRKMLRRTFAGRFEIEEALRKCGLSPTARAQELSLDAWISLFLLFADEIAEEKRKKDEAGAP